MNPEILTAFYFGIGLLLSVVAFAAIILLCYAGFLGTSIAFRARTKSRVMTLKKRPTLMDPELQEDEHLFI